MASGKGNIAAGRSPRLLLAALVGAAMVGFLSFNGHLFHKPEVYETKHSLLTSDFFAFPTVEQRIAYYMATWYPPQSSLDKEKQSMCGKVYWHHGNTHYGNVEFFNGDKTGLFSRTPKLYDEENLLKQASNDYVQDVLKYIVPYWNKSGIHNSNSKNDNALFLMHLGDTSNRYDLPVMTKTRPASTFSSNMSSLVQEEDRFVLPILVPLEMRRHFHSDMKRVKGSDKKWENKRDAMVWRGVTTGNRVKIIPNIIDDLDEKDFDIGFTVLLQGEENNKEAKRIMKPSLTLKNQLSFKYLLSIEGNDVATGLKWQLYSNSVVFMPPPTTASWAMEDKLVPYYHYIPLANDLSDLEEKLEWARENDDLCHGIAQKATQYMEDLWMSGKAQEDTFRIVAGIVERYQEHFGQALRKCNMARTNTTDNVVL